MDPDNHPNPSASPEKNNCNLENFSFVKTISFSPPDNNSDSEHTFPSKTLIMRDENGSAVRWSPFQLPESDDIIGPQKMFGGSELDIDILPVSIKTEVQTENSDDEDELCSQNDEQFNDMDSDENSDCSISLPVKKMRGLTSQAENMDCSGPMKKLRSAISQVSNPLSEFLNRFSGFELKDEEVMQTFFQSVLNIIDSASMTEQTRLKESLEKTKSENKSLRSRLQKIHQRNSHKDCNCTSKRKLQDLEKALKAKDWLLQEQLLKIAELRSEIQKQDPELQKKLNECEQRFLNQRTKATNFAIEAQELKADNKILKEEISKSKEIIRNAELDKAKLETQNKELQEVEAKQKSKIASLEMQLLDLHSDLIAKIERMEKQRERIFHALKGSTAMAIPHFVSNTSSSSAEEFNGGELSSRKRKSSDDDQFLADKDEVTAETTSNKLSLTS